MNIKKFLITTSLITVLMIPNTALASTPLAGVNPTKITGNISFQIIANYDNANPKEIATLVNMSKLDKNLKVLVSSDNSVNVTRNYPAIQGMVFVNGKEVAVNENGQYSADVSDSLATVEFKTKGKQQLLQSKKVVTSNAKSLNVDLVDSISFSSFVESMDKTPVQTNSAISTGIVPNSRSGGQVDGEAVYYGDLVHCNRFNGPNSDHHYWVWYHPTAMIDFANSDCDLDLQRYGCPLPPFSDNLCDGLNIKGNGHNDCSDIDASFHWFAWFR